MTRFVLIEDEPGFAEALKIWIHAHAAHFGEIEVVVCDTLSSGQMKAEKASLILLDLMLPDSGPMDTIGVIPHLRKFAPVLVVTGYAESVPPMERQIVRKAISECGADNVIYKDMIMTRDGMDWLGLTIAGAMWRRAFAKKQEGHEGH